MPRVQQVLKLMLEEGMAWIDSQRPDGEAAYWFPSLFGAWAGELSQLRPLYGSVSIRVLIAARLRREKQCCQSSNRAGNDCHVTGASTSSFLKFVRRTVLTALCQSSARVSLYVSLCSFVADSICMLFSPWVLVFHVVALFW